jgi:hypothetical protein
MRRLPLLLLVGLLAASPALAQVLLFDFQPSGGPLESGYTPVTLNDIYDPRTGYGFTETPRSESDGSSKTWNFYGRTVTLEQAIPTEVLSDKTRDCVLSGRPYSFRVDLPAGNYDVTLWLGDVTTPRYRVRATVNGVDVDVDRMDINHLRGSFDMAEIGNAVPRSVRVDAASGFIEVALGPMPDPGPVTWDHPLDQCPTPPAGGPVYTSTLIPAHDAAALQAITIHPAVDPPLVGGAGVLAIGSAPADPTLPTTSRCCSCTAPAPQ